METNARPRLPVEVCERIIEHVYSSRQDLIPAMRATLCNCALVCRAWRPRAQIILFKRVEVRDKDSLYRLAELLHSTSGDLGSYIRTLDIRGHLNVPQSPAVLFPSVVGRRLANLSRLTITGFGCNNGPRDGHCSRLGSKTELPCLPVHPYFPSLMSPVSHIHRLSLTMLTFPSFADFARVLATLRNLRYLWCQTVSWTALGPESRCMAKDRPHDSRHTFLPKLEMLEVCP